MTDKRRPVAAKRTVSAKMILTEYELYSNEVGMLAATAVHCTFSMSICEKNTFF